MVELIEIVFKDLSVSFHAGPWHGEPSFYKEVYADGTIVSINRNMLIGTLSGYVRIAKDLDFISSKISVHGGLSYNGYESKKGQILYRKLGFDCFHVGDVLPCSLNNSSSDTYRDIAYVINEARSLRKQLLESAAGIAQLVES